MQLPKKLKELIGKREITVAELSKRTGVPTNTLHNWLAGQPPRNLVQVKQVADYFGVTVDHLVFGTALQLDSEKLSELTLKGHFEVVLRPVRKEGES